MAESRSFSEALAFGKEGEHLVAEALLRQGCSVAPLYQFQTEGTAPVMLWRRGDTLTKCVLPDLTVWSARREVAFVEVKRKTRWVNFMEYLETGFNERHFQHYLDLKRQIGVPVWICFVHESKDPTGVYVGEISKLNQHLRVWDGCVHDFDISGETCVERTHRMSPPLALFPIHALRKWATLDAIARSEAA